MRTIPIEVTWTEVYHKNLEIPDDITTERKLNQFITDYVSDPDFRHGDLKFYDETQDWDFQDYTQDVAGNYD